AFALLAHVRPAAPVRRVTLLETFIAGFRFHGGPGIEHTLRAGDRLRLVREPRNLHDHSAIAVHTLSGARLGYIPRRHNAVAARLMDQGIRLDAVIDAIRPPPAPPWERVFVVVRTSAQSAASGDHPPDRERGNERGAAWPRRGPLVPARHALRHFEAMDADAARSRPPSPRRPVRAVAGADSGTRRRRRPAD